MDLLERERALEQMAELLHQATSKQGQTVLLSGEAGIGKTALVDAFVRQHAGTIRALWGACEALFTPRPLGPLYDIASQVRGRLGTLIGQTMERSLLFSAFLEELQQATVPTVVIFEDVHWADEATLDLIKFLGRRILPLSVVFVVTYRDNELGREHPLRSVLGDLPANAVTRLRLTPLSEQTVARLAQQAQREGKRLYTVTGGNPFFVTEVLASAVPGVPLMVRDAVVARLMRVSPDARSLLELVSVVPARVERWLLEALLEASTEAVEECLSSGLLILEQQTVAFRHELARQAVESTLSPWCLQQLHARVLAALLSQGEEQAQAARLVHHALGARDTRQATRYAVEAARQAAEQGAHREAAAQYATALHDPSQFSHERRAELLEKRAYECYLTSQIEEARWAWQEALSIWQELDRPAQVGQALLWLSRISWYLGKASDAQQYAVETVALLETLPPDARLAMAYSNRAHLAMLADNLAEALHWGKRAMALAEKLGDEETLVHALNNLGTALLTAQDKQGKEYLEQSLQLAMQRGWEEHVARVYTNLACCAVIARDYPQAESFLQEGLTYCLEHDLDACGMYLVGWQARACFEQGRWDDAAAAAARVLEQYGLSAAIRLPALVVLGNIRVRRGDPGSSALLDEARELALATQEPQCIVPMAAARAEAAWLQEDLEQCLEEVRASDNLDLTHSDPWKRGELSIWRWRAGSPLEECGPIAEPYAYQIAGDWRGAAERWALLGCPYEQALALANGNACAQQDALAIFTQLGAQPALTLLRRRLRQQGITGIPRGPRPSTRANQAGLTSRQLEVLQLMAQGLSNVEISSRLFTSLKTVEHHVSAVLAKLGVHSRAQAIQVASHKEFLPSGEQSPVL